MAPPPVSGTAEGDGFGRRRRLLHTPILGLRPCGATRSIFGRAADARLAKKGSGREAKLSDAGHVLMENRHGLVIDTRLTPADGYAEIGAALLMLEALPDRRGVTVAADSRTTSGGSL